MLEVSDLEKRIIRWFPLVAGDSILQLCVSRPRGNVRARKCATEERTGVEVVFLRGKMWELVMKRDADVQTEGGKLAVQSWVCVRDEAERRVQDEF